MRKFWWVLWVLNATVTSLEIVVGTSVGVVLFGIAATVFCWLNLRGESPRTRCELEAKRAAFERDQWLLEADVDQLSERALAGESLDHGDPSRPKPRPLPPPDRDHLISMGASAAEADALVESAARRRALELVMPPAPTSIPSGGERFHN